MMPVGAWGPWAAGLPARCRELRALALVYLGKVHPVTVALDEAVAEPAALEIARAELSAIPALRRRLLLAAYVALLPANRTQGGHPRRYQSR